MYYVFPALERRFTANKRLVGLARKLYHGLDGANVKSREHVDVVGEITHHDFDTFDTDEPLYSLTFTVQSKGSRAGKVAEILRELRRTFDDGTLESGDFTVSSMRETGADGPRLVDGVYTATLTYELHVVLRSLVPANRGG